MKVRRRPDELLHKQCRRGDTQLKSFIVKSTVTHLMDTTEVALMHETPLHAPVMVSLQCRSLPDFVPFSVPPPQYWLKLRMPTVGDEQYGSHVGRGKFQDRRWARHITLSQFPPRAFLLVL